MMRVAGTNGHSAGRLHHNRLLPSFLRRQPIPRPPSICPQPPPLAPRGPRHHRHHRTDLLKLESALEMHA